MARIRSLKPELPSDRKLTTITREARYTFVLLITQADDDGLVRAEPRQLLGVLYPFDEDVDSLLLEGWIAEMYRIGLIRFRQTRDGVRVIQIVHWDRHQVIKNRSKPFLLHQLVDNGADPVEGSVNSPESGGSPSGDSGGAESGVLSQESGVRSPESGGSESGGSVASQPASRTVATAVAEGERAELVIEPSSRGAPLAQVAGTIRKAWWGPDGKPPPGWEMGRELAIWKRILEVTPLDECLAVIHGARYLQQAGDTYWRPERVSVAWLQGAKLTAKIFRSEHSLDLWDFAFAAYMQGPPAAAKPPPRGRGTREPDKPARLAELVRGGRGR